ncbi:MAG TPA: hypothetical protein VN608_10530 [Clostridia bacterium]|nr:hypothetical protein [Clostridia bacterium]
MTFDMSNPRHVEALALFSAQPDRSRSEFIINCILQAEQESRLEAVIRKSVSEALEGIRFVERKPLPEKEAALTDNISDLPGALLSMMDI